MRRTGIIKYLAFVCCLFLGLSWLPMTAQAENTSDALRDEINKLQSQEQALNAKLEKLEEQLVSNTEAIADAVNQKDVLDQQVTLLHEQIRNINAQIVSYNQVIADMRAELESVIARQNELYVKHKQRIRAMEERGKMSYWNILFRSSSITDLLDRLSIIQQIAEADQRNLSDLRRASTIAIAVKDEMERNREKLDESRVQLDKSMQELEAKRDEADKLLQDLIAKGEEYERLLLQSEDKQDDLLSKLANKKSAYNRQAYEEWLANSQQNNGPDFYDDNWQSPLTQYRLTSPFGMRLHPILKKNRMHNGVDMAAAANTPIYAARGGLVITTAYQKNGAGNYVQIDHGDGFRSIYMHMTQYIVKSGDYVVPGQIIGYVGSTGLSSGNHLHFGISKNGVYVNPMEYIPSV